MKENMLDVLIYLFENYMFEEQVIQPDQEAIVAELSQAGFETGEIDKAIDWLADLSEMREQLMEDRFAGGRSDSVRHFSPLEQARIGGTIQRLLLSLEQSGVIDPEAREMVIDRIMALEEVDLDLDHVKWIVMLVLSSRADQGEDTLLVEELSVDYLPGSLH